MVEHVGRDDGGTCLPKRTFVVQIIDRALGRIVSETIFEPDDISRLAEAIGVDLNASTDLLDLYYPTQGQVEKLSSIYGLGSEFSQKSNLVRLHDIRWRGNLPYIPHGELSLSLFWDGTKKFGYVDHRRPPAFYDQEDEIDAAVRQGFLKKFVCGADLACSSEKHNDTLRTILLTRPEEEWRALAYLNLIDASRTTGWSELAERQLSSLFGYEEWQTKWWIQHTKSRRGSFSGLPVIFGASSSEIQNIRLLGGKAFLPDTEADGFNIFSLKKYSLPSKSEVESQYHIDHPFVCSASLPFFFLETLPRLDKLNGYRVVGSDVAKFNQSLRSDIKIICELD